MARTLLSWSASLIVCAVDSVVGLEIGWFHDCAAAAVHEPAVNTAINVKYLMLLGWARDGMDHGVPIVGNLVETGRLSGLRRSFVGPSHACAASV